MSFGGDPWLNHLRVIVRVVRVSALNLNLLGWIWLWLRQSPTPRWRRRRRQHRLWRSVLNKEELANLLEAISVQLLQGPVRPQYSHGLGDSFALFCLLL